MEEQNMTNAELTVLLKLLADLIRAKAKSVEDAAKIIEEAIPKN